MLGDWTIEIVSIHEVTLDVDMRKTFADVTRLVPNDWRLADYSVAEAFCGNGYAIYDGKGLVGIANETAITPVEPEIQLSELGAERLLPRAIAALRKAECTSLAKELAELVNALCAYNQSLEDREIPPDGDAYNDIMDIVTR